MCLANVGSTQACPTSPFLRSSRCPLFRPHGGQVRFFCSTTPRPDGHRCRVFALSALTVPRWYRWPRAPLPLISLSLCHYNCVFGVSVRLSPRLFTSRWMLATHFRSARFAMHDSHRDGFLHLFRHTHTSCVRSSFLGQSRAHDVDHDRDVPCPRHSCSDPGCLVLARFGSPEGAVMDH